MRSRFLFVLLSTVASAAAFAIYRDAECGRQRAMMDAGTGAGDVERSCRILLAEQRALELASR